MPIAHVANASLASNDTAAPFTQDVVIPGAAAVGQFGLCLFAASTNIAVGTPTSPGSGSWTPAYAEVTNGTVMRHRAFWKFLTAGDPGGTLSSVFGATGKTAGSVRVYSGVDPTTPIAISPTFDYQTTTSTTIVAPAITPDNFYVSFVLYRGTAPIVCTNAGLANVGGATQAGSGTASITGGDSASDLDGGTTWTGTSVANRSVISIALNELAVVAASPQVWGLSRI